MSAHAQLHQIGKMLLLGGRSGQYRSTNTLKDWAVMQAFGFTISLGFPAPVSLQKNNRHHYKKKAKFFQNIFFRLRRQKRIIRSW